VVARGRVVRVSGGAQCARWEMERISATYPHKTAVVHDFSLIKYININDYAYNRTIFVHYSTFVRKMRYIERVRRNRAERAGWEMGEKWQKIAVV